MKEEKKLTDEEIVKDIERSTGMPSYWKTIVLDLIHRLQRENAEQKAEIERLNGLVSQSQMREVDWIEKYDKTLGENKELQKQVDELKDTLTQYMNGELVNEDVFLRQVEAIKQARKYTAKKYNEFVHALICKHNCGIDDNTYGNMHKEADEYAKEYYGLEVGGWRKLE